MYCRVSLENTPIPTPCLPLKGRVFSSSFVSPWLMSGSSENPFGGTGKSRLSPYHLVSLFFILPFIMISAVSCSPSVNIYKRSQVLMGTVVEITVVAQDEARAEEAMTAAFKEIRRLEEIMSTYIPSSDISRVNAAAGLSPVKVHKDLILVVKKALEFARLSGGAFNIALGPAIDLWNVTEADRIPSDQELEAIRPLIDLRNIIVDETAETLFLREKGMRINLGGIGKGIAADYAHNILFKHGIRSGIIAVAGDLRVFGKRPDGSAWNIGIRHPRKKEGVMAQVRFSDMSDMAISTSGDYERFFMKNGVRYHHVLSSDTLHPSLGNQSVSVIARDSTTADAISTAIFAMDPEKGFKLLESLPEVEGIIMGEDGRIGLSPGLKGHPKVAIEIIH